VAGNLVFIGVLNGTLEARDLNSGDLVWEFQTEASRQGGDLGAVLYCPHAPEEGCACRKPAPGLIQEALARSGFTAAESLVVGDDRRDLEAASRAGVPAALVRTGKGRKTEMLLNGAPVPTYDDLAHVARAILEAHEHRVT